MAISHAQPAQPARAYQICIKKILPAQCVYSLFASPLNTMFRNVKKKKEI